MLSRGLWTLTLAELIVAVTLAADPINFPPLPDPVLPSPMPAVVDPPLMAVDELYPVDCSVECVIRTNPPGRMAFDKWEVGSVYAKFYGGGGKVEKRKFNGPFLYVGRVIKADGDVTVTVVPLGLKKEDEIQDRVIRLSPPQPAPVDPKVDPKPDPAKPAPIPEVGFHILIVYERDTFGDLPLKQQSIIDGGEFRDFLDANCTKDGDQPGYRIIDKDTLVTNESEMWKKALTRPRTGLPWIVVSNGKTGTEELLPADTAAAIALAGKYLPAKGRK